MGIRKRHPQRTVIGVIQSTQVDGMNASLYKSYAMSLEGSIENEEWAAILAFLDIYENSESNEAIEEKVSLL